MSKKAGAFFPWGLLALTLLLVSFRVYPASQEKSLSQYVISLWTALDGLPQNSINNIIQTDDGYLWFATQDGLARFNGNGFRVFDRDNTPAMTTSQVTVLYKSRDGALWIGTDGGGLVRYQEGRFRHFDGGDNIPGNLSISDITEDPRGDLWIAAEGKRLFRKSRDTIAEIHLPGEDPITDFRRLYFDRSGTFWILSHNGLFCHQSGRLIPILEKEGLSSTNVTIMLQDRSGSYWIGTEGSGLNLIRKGQFSHLSSKNGLVNDDILSIVEDRQGSIWVGTRGGLCRIQGGVISTMTSDSGLSNNTVTGIFEDREGSLWLGTSYGANRLRDGLAVTMGVQQGLPTEFVWSVYEDSRHVFWIGTHGRGLVRQEAGRLSILSTREGLPNNVVRCTLEDRLGRLWIGTFAGLACLEKGRMKIYGAGHGLSDNLIRAIFEDDRGRLWVGTASGLNFLEGDNFRTYPLDGAPQPLLVFGIFQDRGGDVWIGSRQAAIRISTGRHQIFDKSNSVLSDRVYTFAQDREGTIWFGTSIGLGLFRGNAFRLLTKKDGLPDNVIYKIIVDQSGDFWLSSNRGIIHLRTQDIHDYLGGKTDRLHPETLGLEDGLKTMECNGGSQSSGCIDHEGRIYFPTLKGLAIVNPGQKKENRIAPPVKIEEVMADGRSLPPDAKAELAPGTGRLEFHFAALSFLMPQKVRFKYKLVGMDKEWVEAGNRHEAYYTNIPPGEYQFRVIACNNDGLWNEEGATYFFTQKPFFTQTKLFYFLVLLAIFLSGLGVSLMRVKRLKKRERELAGLVAARTQELAVANRELERLANTDGLTEVANHRSFMEAFQVEWKRAERSGLPLSLIMIDVDHFKLYNDNYGHQAGDDCLKRIAAVLKKSVERAGDRVARYGGEEFAVLLMATERRGVLAVAGKLRERVAGLEIPHEHSPVAHHITISLGVSTDIPSRGKSPSSLIEAADQALYKAKADGRDCVRATPAREGGMEPAKNPAFSA